MPEQTSGTNAALGGSRDHIVVEGRLVEQGSKHLYGAGIAVFVIAAIFGVGFLAFTSHFGILEDWARLRTVQLFAMIAAVGIVVAIVARSTNAFVAVFGILLIGALIVPTKDMVSLALLASGRDSAADDEDRAIEDGAEYKGRANDLANKIVSALQSAPRQPGSQSGPRILGSLNASERGQAVLAVETALDDERKVSSLDRARLGGYIPVLMSFAEGKKDPTNTENITDDNTGFQKFYFRHGIDHSFVEDLLELRRQELIQFSYSELSDAKITHLGKEVVCEYYRVVENNIRDCPFNDILESDQLISDQLTLPLSFSERAEELCYGISNEQVLTVMSYPFSHTSPVLFGAIIPVSSTTPRELRVTLSKVADGDPVVTVFRRSGTGSNTGCNYVTYDDDSGGNLNSVLTLSPELSEMGTEYFLVADDLLGGTADMRLTVTEVAHEQSEPAPEQENVPPTGAAISPDTEVLQGSSDTSK